MTEAFKKDIILSLGGIVIFALSVWQKSHWIFVLFYTLFAIGMSSSFDFDDENEEDEEE